MGQPKSTSNYLFLHSFFLKLLLTVRCQRTQLWQGEKGGIYGKRGDLTTDMSLLLSPPSTEPVDKEIYVNSHWKYVEI